MIKLEYIRSSMSSTHSMCSLKFFLGYMLGFDERPAKKTCMGTIFHKVFEILAKIKLAQQNGKSSVDDEATGKFYLKTYTVDKIYDKAYKYYTSHFTHDVWCKKEKKYLPLVWTDEEYQTVKRWIDQALTLNEGEYDPRNQNIVSPEDHFDFTLEDPELSFLRLCGTIDLVTKLDDGTLHIVDYKTGQRKNWGTGKTKEYGDFMKDFQLNLYHLAARFLYPEVDNIIITIYYIDDGGPYTIPFGKCDLANIITDIKKLYNEITRTTPQKRRGFWCGFCSYSKQTYEGTNVLPIINTGHEGCHFTEIGKPMCKCDQTAYVLKHRSVDTVIDKMTKTGHNSGKYKPPGEVE